MKQITHKTRGFLAMLAVFVGWGMVMGGGAAGSKVILYLGGFLLGVGVIYLLYRLYLMIKAREQQE